MENAIMDINMAACDSERKPLPTAANSEPSRPASTVESGSRENFDQIIWNLYLAWIRVVITRGENDSKQSDEIQTTQYSSIYKKEKLLFSTN